MPAVAGYVRSFIVDRHDREDLVQEVAAAAFGAFATYDEGRSFTSWVLGIAHHKALNRIRSYRRSRILISDPALIGDLATLHDEESERFASEREALNDCLPKIQARGWDVVRLHYGDGLPPEQLATRLGTSASNIRQILHRVRVALRTCIERRLESDHA